MSARIFKCSLKVSYSVSRQKPLQNRSARYTSMTSLQATVDRKADISTNLQDVRERVKSASGSRPTELGAPLLVAVSKYKPSSDVLACYEQGQRDFGENYVQELVDKAKELPEEIKWHFIGSLQSNKAKLLASIPNLYAVQTLSSIKAADALNRAIPLTRETPLNILLQVNTSGEESKSGLAQLSGSETIPSSNASASEELPPGDPNLMILARHIIVNCQRLRLQGLMTIGSIAESTKEGDDENTEFAALRATRDRLQEWLAGAYKLGGAEGFQWGENGRLLLSMGMSSDFEAALRAGSDIVRVGTGVFGERHKKGES